MSISPVKETECFGICHFANRMFLKHMETASLVMSSALWP
jgi:hypothetical protein